MLNVDKCYAILGHRDPGADGRFFVAVKTTGIYCRPICPARVPLRRNIIFYEHAAEAQAAGFRPCLRCRPESAPDSPAWVGSLASINRALALIDEGALVDEGVEQLAQRLGMTARHLRRLFVKHLGIGPVMVEQTRRVHLAKKLVHETSLSMTDIAFASGFGSLRRFNETFRDMFGRPPSSLRRAIRPSDITDRIAISLSFRPPLDWFAKQAEARCSGAVIIDDQIHHSFDFDGIKAAYSLSPKNETSLTVILEQIPLALLGKTIARIKRIHLSSFLPPATARQHLDMSRYITTLRGGGIMQPLCLNRHDISLIGDSLGAGPTALLLHAGGERRAVWYPIMRDLEEAGIGSLTFDQRGHGQSGGSRDDSVIAFGEDAAAMIADAACPVVVGASLGGFAAMLALAKPEVRAEAAGLILVDVVPDPDPVRVRAFLKLRMGQNSHVEDTLTRADQFRAAVASLDIPVLLVRAGRDGALSDDEVARLTEQIPHLETVSVSGAGHLIAREAPGELATLIREFMRSDAVRDRRIGWFVQRRRGDTIAHPGGTLATHLARVADQLRDWGADAVVVDAARLHAAYGTDGFGAAIVSTGGRAEVVRAVGAASEALVQLYCACDRKASYPSWTTDTPVVVEREGGVLRPIADITRRALMELTVANELDVMLHDRRLADEYGPALLAQFRQWRPWMSAAATRAIDSLTAEAGHRVE